MSKTKYHLKAVGETLELVLIADIFIAFAGLLWLIHDAVSYGFGFGYLLIFLLLLPSTVVLVMAFIRHHNGNLKRIMHETLTMKIKHTKIKNKHTVRRKF